VKSAATSIPNERLRRQRVVRGWTLQDVADKLYDLCLQDGGNRRTWGINADTVGRWERGKSHPHDIYRAKLRILFNASDEELGFLDGHNDRKMNEALSPQSREGTVLLGQQGAEASGSRREDWGEAPHIEQFYGRDKELKQLRQWMVDDPCHLTAIVGMGGIGKTSLATALAHHIKDSFAFVLWRSLRNAPALKDILRGCLQFFSHRRTDLPEQVNDQIVLLLECFREHRCLLVLDNAETVLQGGKEAGTTYREGYEG
jgi:transcriptional regulator with XRE-family HTH domain